MNLVQAWLTRYLARVDELEALKAQLESKGRPGDPAPIVGRVLEAAGDLFRRSQKVPHDAAAVDRVLNLIPAAALLSWEEAIAFDALAQRLVRAADEAVESALPDASDDGHAFAAWALEGLSMRDRLESALVALKRLAGLGRADAGLAHGRVAARLEPIDRRGRKLARALTALNPARREEVALLDAGLRPRAWWYGELDSREHDGLVRALGGEGEAPTRGLEAEVAQALDQPHRRPVTEDELFRYDLGLASPAEVAIIQRQAKEDRALARALAAMEDAERVIADLEGAAVAASPQVGRGAARETPSVRILDERPWGTVLLMRRKARLFLVLQPRQERFAAAAVFLAAQPDKPCPMKRRSEGLEFDLGLEDRLGGTQVRAVLRLLGGEERELNLGLP